MKGLAVSFIVIILGLSLVGSGYLSGSQSGDHNSWWNSGWDYKGGDWYKSFSKYFDYKKVIGWMSSGGSNNDDHHDDDEDGVPQSPIDNAKVSFIINPRPIDDNGERYFQNVVDKCVFSSTDSFDPLCVRCKILDMSGEVIGKGEVIDFKKSYNSPEQVMIPLTSEPPVDPKKPAYNVVDQFSSVKLSVCAPPNDECDDHDTCKCDERKKDHANHYSDFHKRYLDNKNKFSKDDYEKFIDDYEKYMDDEGKYMDKSDYKMFMDYHEKFLKDNKKYFSSSEYNKHSSEHNKYSRDYPNHDEKCNCHGEKEDHEKHYDDFDKYYKYNKNKFSKNDYEKFMDDYEKYMDDERKYMDSSDYKMFMDNHEKLLKENKKYFSSNDYKKHSDEHEKYSKDYPKHEEDDNECKEKSGFFTGGGKVYVPKSGNIPKFTLTHGFELHCDQHLGPNNLEVNWLQNKFHLEELEKANCVDDGTHNEPPPSPHPGPTLDIYNGEGYGRYNGQCGAYATWSMSDNGEPGKNDEILSLKIYDSKGGNVVLDIHDLNLQSGNHQFVPHPATHQNPPTQTNPCPEVTP